MPYKPSDTPDEGGNKAKETWYRRTSLSADTATELDMDHVRLSFFQLLWVYTFVGLNAHFLAVKNTLGLRICNWLNSIGLVKPLPVDYDELAAKFCLETTLAVHYYSRADKDSNLGNVAGFYFAGEPLNTICL